MKILWDKVNGKRRRGRQKKRQEDNIKKGTGMDIVSSTRAVVNGTRWRRIVAKSSVAPQRPCKVMEKTRLVLEKSCYWGMLIHLNFAPILQRETNFEILC